MQRSKSLIFGCFIIVVMLSFTIYSSDNTASEGYHNVALREDGSVVPWGSGDDGLSEVPPDNSGFVAVDTGDRYSNRNPYWRS